MITITEEIIINADIQKVWGFLSDFEISLNINSFHQEIILPNKFSLTDKYQKFSIIHNFGLGNIDMDVKIVDYNPLKLIQLFKYNNNKLHKAFEHSSTYELTKKGELTKLNYIIKGSFNFKIQNIPFRPILIKVMKNELLNMKNMIESSDRIPQDIESKITAT